jgi:CheY-like chemotaxis protein
MAKRALIVDDSKTAQVRLRKMLERFDIEIDTSSSAEEALGYLSYRQPSVIFLDHHMEGMSGLSALRIIKSNPATALIPVVMYTSEQGDVYVGQARALGALDIISKEVIQHSSIEKVLSSLGIATLGEESETSETVSTVTATGKSKVQNQNSTANVSSIEQWGDDAGNKPLPYTASSDLNKIQAQVGKLFEIHIAKVRQEIEDNTKFLMRRLSQEIQNSAAPKVAVGAAAKLPPVLDANDVGVAKPNADSNAVVRRYSMLLLFAMVVVIGMAIEQVLTNREDQKQLLAVHASLVEKLQLQGDATTRILTEIAEKPEIPKAGTDARVMLDALGWAVNLDPLVPFGEKALNDQRIYMLGELLALLKAANFRGTVFVDINLGNFCAVRAQSGEWLLPEQESNLEDCVFLADQDFDVSLNNQVSVGFLNYLQSTPVLSDGDIGVELSSLGFGSPKFSYPPTTSGTSAGQWNAAAAKNSRIAFSFSPE